MADEDVTLPKATIQKLIKEMLPSGIKCSNDTRDLVLQCCVEFIHLISSEANEVCTKEGKKTIGPKHVIEALKALGFEDYITEVNDVFREVESMEKPKKMRKSLDTLGIPQEQLLQEQMALFAKARNALNSSKGGEAAPSPTLDVGQPTDQ